MPRDDLKVEFFLEVFEGNEHVHFPLIFPVIIAETADGTFLFFYEPYDLKRNVDEGRDKKCKIGITDQRDAQNLKDDAEVNRVPHVLESSDMDEADLFDLLGADRMDSPLFSQGFHSPPPKPESEDVEQDPETHHDIIE